MNSIMDRKARRECSEVLRFLFFASTIGLLGAPLLTALLVALLGFAFGEPGIDMASKFLDSSLLSFLKAAGCFYLVGLAGLALLFGFRAENTDLLLTRIDRLLEQPIIDAIRRLFTLINRDTSVVIASTYSVQMCHRVPIHRPSRTGLNRASNLAGFTPQVE